MKSIKKELSPKQRDELLATLQARFDANQDRHPGLAWAKVQARLEARPEKLWSLAEMERTGGEPDVVGHHEKSGEFVFFDCSERSSASRTSQCYNSQNWMFSTSRNNSVAWRGQLPGGLIAEMNLVGIRFGVISGS